MSRFSQMAGLTVRNFVSGATGLALADALTRGFARSRAATVGDFWVDLTRARLYVPAPLAVVTLLLVGRVGCVYLAETAGDPILKALGLDPAQGDMEGEEVRFGQPASRPLTPR